jgi:predicted Zn-dependent peptidase
VCSRDKNYYAAILFNEIFGGSPASKLFMNVRERLSLCYYCSSHYDSYFGNMTVSSGVDGANAELAKREILAQLEDMKAGKISDVEFSAASSPLSITAARPTIIPVIYSPSIAHAACSE